MATQMHAALPLLKRPQPSPERGPAPRLSPSPTYQSPRFSPQASFRLARRVRAVRVAIERAALRRIDHPVPLATGVCTARLLVSHTGRVTRMTRLRCSTEGLRATLWRAAFLSRPLRLMPATHRYAVWIRVIANIPEPGLLDGFTH